MSLKEVLDWYTTSSRIKPYSGCVELIILRVGSSGVWRAILAIGFGVESMGLIGILLVELVVINAGTMGLEEEVRRDSVFFISLFHHARDMLTRGIR